MYVLLFVFFLSLVKFSASEATALWRYRSFIIIIIFFFFIIIRFSIFFVFVYHCMVK